MQFMMKQMLQSLLMAGVLPAVMISALSTAFRKPEDITAVPNNNTPGYEITVISNNGEAQKMELETYITCVLLGEVPDNFHEEALKAQAVAARTYTLYCIDVLKKHAGGAVCTDYHCCQAYCEPEKFIKDGGTDTGLQKISNSVKETAGEVLRYGQDLICATYFASSGGQTEDAVEVWRKEYPYLRSTVSPGEEDCGYFRKQVSFSATELQNALGVHLTGQPCSWFGMVTHTVGGGVDLMRIGGRLYTGVELRKLLKLQSTIMKILVKDDNITIDTKGYGHRVGMSQHGANAMANDGYEYQTILKHYYSDITLGPYAR